MDSTIAEKLQQAEAKIEESEDERQRISGNITTAYAVANSKGATMPANRNSANLAQTINSIPSGGSSTLITTAITENGIYTAEDDNADGYFEVVVNVQTPTPVIDNTGIDLLSLEEHKGYRKPDGSISSNGTDPNWSWFDPVNIGERKMVLYRLWGYTTVMSLMVWNADEAIIDTVHIASGSGYFSGKYTIPNGGTRIAVSCFNTIARADQICVLI
jgi:hypothetical protein